MIVKRLYKNEKLCSKTAVDLLFAEGKSVMAYPLRAVWRVSNVPPVVNGIEKHAPVQFLISIPKKKIRMAVQRVLLRRRTREAFRLNREVLYPALAEAGVRIDIAFVWLSKEAAPFSVIQPKMVEILSKIAKCV